MKTLTNGFASHMLQGNTEPANCMPCTPGYYCGGVGLIQESAMCDAGFYCPEGQSTASPGEYICPRGHQCPVGTAEPIICPRGKRNTRQSDIFIDRYEVLTRK